MLMLVNMIISVKRTGKGKHLYVICFVLFIANVHSNYVPERNSQSLISRLSYKKHLKQMSHITHIEGQSDAQLQPRCKPGTQWQKDCNTCRCADDGLEACTRKACLPDPGQYFLEKPSLPPKSECTPDTAWYDDCNKCTCVDGKPYCTEKKCYSSNPTEPQYPTQQPRPLVLPMPSRPPSGLPPPGRPPSGRPPPGRPPPGRPPPGRPPPGRPPPGRPPSGRRPSGHIPVIMPGEIRDLAPLGRCSPGRVWFNDCNKCTCMGGEALCTKKQCPIQPMNNLVSSPDSCTPEKLYMDDCGEICRCPLHGRAGLCNSKTACKPRDPAVCMLPPDAGPCFSNPTTRYYYVWDKNKCLPFSYGGCEGNNNKFNTIEECIMTCGITSRSRAKLRGIAPPGRRYAPPVRPAAHRPPRLPQVIPAEEIGRLFVPERGEYPRPGQMKPSPYEPVPSQMKPSPYEAIPRGFKPSPYDAIPSQMKPSPYEPLPSQIKPSLYEPIPTQMKPSPYEPIPSQIKPSPYKSIAPPMKPSPYETIMPSQLKPKPNPYEPLPSLIKPQPYPRPESDRGSPGYPGGPRYSPGSMYPQEAIELPSKFSPLDPMGSPGPRETLMDNVKKLPPDYMKDFNFLKKHDQPIPSRQKYELSASVLEKQFKLNKEKYNSLG